MKVKEVFFLFNENLAKNWILWEEYKKREVTRLMKTVYVIEKEPIF